MNVKCPFFYFFLSQVQLLTSLSSISHRAIQVKGETAPETSLLMGAGPTQGVPGEQGPAGRCTVDAMLSCLNMSCV